MEVHLVILQPFLQQLLTALLQDRAGEFDGFGMVELAFLEKDAKVLENRGEASRRRRCLLKRLDNRSSTQNTLTSNKSATKAPIER